MANMKQIAKLAGVSLGTVSHVLNGTAKVREPLRKRVLEAVQASGYQPSQLARGLRRDKTDIIAMIIPDIVNPFFPSVVRGAEDMAFADGYRLILCNTDNDHAKEIVQLQALRSYLPSGLIVIPSNFSDLTAQAKSYRENGAAVVCIDRLPPNWDGDTVTIDNVESACKATRFLIAQGHKSIATITGPQFLTNAQDRLTGFRQAMQEAGLMPASGHIQEATFDQAGGYSKTKILLRLLPRPTAIFAGNDMIAMGSLRAIREAGLRCPEDVSLIGFDGLELTEMITPQLTSIYQSPYQLGAAAARIVLDRMADRDCPTQHIVLETELKVRESVAPPMAPAAQRSKVTQTRQTKNDKLRSL
jgi:LacI family transcriptional regulator